MQPRQQQQLDRMAERMENTAIIQERMLARLDALEHWREEQDERRDRQEERREVRIDHAPDSRIAVYALTVSVGTFLFYALSFLSAHWK